MKRFETIKSHEEFNKIINSSKYLKNRYFTLYITKRKENHVRFGLAISKKVGNAVLRNKLKRKVRALIDLNKDIFPNEYDYIIMIRKDCEKLSFQELNLKLQELIKEI